MRTVDLFMAHCLAALITRGDKKTREALIEEALEYAVIAKEAVEAWEKKESGFLSS